MKKQFKIILSLIVIVLIMSLSLSVNAMRIEDYTGTLESTSQIGTVYANYITNLDIENLIINDWVDNATYKITVGYYRHSGANPYYTTSYSYPKIPKPSKSPFTDGYIFKGWFADNACETPFDFSIEYQTSQTVNIYAGWEYVGHSFSGASLTLENNLNVNFCVEKKLFDNEKYGEPYAVFEMNNSKTTVREYSDDGENYIFSFNNISPNKMNDTIKATLFSIYDGKEYCGETKEYSVATYCYSMLEKYKDNKYAAFRTLLVDLLNYGSASQSYTNYNTEHLVNEKLTETQKSWGTSKQPRLNSVSNPEYSKIESPTLIWEGVSLNLKNSIAMQFVFSVEDIKDVSIEIENKNRIIKTFTENDFIKSGNYYIVQFSDLYSTQMSDTVYITAYKNQAPISNTVSYSIESYVSSKINNSDKKLAELVSALIKYGNSSYNYKLGG